MTEQLALVPENITWDMVNAWDGKTMRKYMSIPEYRDAITKVVASRSYQEIQDLAVKQEETASEVNIENSDISTKDALAAPAALEDAASSKTTTDSAPIAVPEPPKKIIVEYQVRDEDENPIGRPTHLEAYTEEEMRKKIIEAHVQATRAFHRLKKQKVQSIQEISKQDEPSSTSPRTMTDEELMATLKDLRSDDPQIQLAAHKKLMQSYEEKAKAEREAKEAEQREFERQKQVSIEFLKRHKHDFNNCQANVDLIGEYFKENKLPWTLDNLEVAFIALEDRLAPVATPAVEVLPEPNPPVPQPTATTTAAAVVQPTPTVPVAPPQPINSVAVPRPGVNGGIVPGQTSAPRPSQKPQGLTMEEILSWDAQTMRAKMRSPLRAEIERVTMEARLRRGR